MAKCEACGKETLVAYEPIKGRFVCLQCFNHINRAVEAAKADAKRRKELLKGYICGTCIAIMCVSVIMIFGTVGAMDCEMISERRGIIQLIVSLGVITGGWIALNLISGRWRLGKHV